MRVTPEPVPALPLEYTLVQEHDSCYLRYWPRQLEAQPRLRSARDLHELTVAGSQFVRGDYGESPYYDETNPGIVPEFPALYVTEEDLQNPATVIEAWDRGLGSFNHMGGGGAADMLRGAAIILQANQAQSSLGFPVVQAQNPRTTSEAFVSLARGLKMEWQKPSHALLIGAQLVHKAALIEPDGKVQRSLFVAASKMYDRIYTGGKRTDEDRLKAGRHLADIRFHRLSDRIRLAAQAGADMEHFRGEAVQLLRGQLSDLFDTGRIREGQVRAGRMFELLSDISLRHLEFVVKGPRGNHVEVRAGFNSEDCPLEPQERRVDNSFDSVVTRATTHGRMTAAALWQLKQGHSLDFRRREYHPAIHIIEGRDITIELMRETGKRLLALYDKDISAKPEAPVAPIRELFQAHMPATKAA